MAHEEAIRVVEVLDSEEDFEASDQPQSLEPLSATFNYLPPAQVSNVQEASDILDAIVLQRKPKISPVKLLKSHVGGLVPKMAVQT